MLRDSKGRMDQKARRRVGIQSTVAMHTWADQDIFSGSRRFQCPPSNASPVYFYPTSDLLSLSVSMEVKLVPRRSGTHTDVITKPINCKWETPWF